MIEQDANGRPITRSQARTVDCPDCGARAGDPCIGRRNPPQVRTSVHLERYRVFAKTCKQVAP